MSTATSSRAVAVEGLRRLLFSPSKLLAVGALACVLAAGGFTLGKEENYDNKTYAETLTVKDDALKITTTGEVAYNDVLVDGQTLTFAGKNHVVGGVARIINGGGLETTESAVTAFQGAVDVSNGSAIVLGDSTDAAFNGVVDVAGSKIDAFGKVVFNDALNLNNQATALFGEKVEFGGVVNVNGSQIDASGAAFKRALNLNNQTTATLRGNATAEQAVTVNGGATLNATEGVAFAKSVVASGASTINASGNANFKGGAVAYGSTINASGNAEFNDEVNVKASGQLNFTGVVDGETVKLNEVLNVDGSKLFSHGNVQYNADVNLTNGSEARFYQKGDAAVKTEFKEDVTLTIGENSKAFADATHLQVDVKLDGGKLTYGNYGDEIFPDAHEIYSTYDENGDKTYLVYNNGKDKIDAAIEKGDVVKNKITGDGTLAFGGFNSFSDSLTLKNGYTVVLDSANSDSKEDHFAFSGATEVNKGFAVIKGDTSFGEKVDNEANVVTVTGEFYDKHNAVADANGYLYADAKADAKARKYIFVEGEGDDKKYFKYDDEGKKEYLAPVDGVLAAYNEDGEAVSIAAQDVAVRDLYKVESAGMLGFYRDGVGDDVDGFVDVAPTLNADTVNFVGGQAHGAKLGLYDEGDVARGARIWLDAKGSKSAYKLGEINANNINFGSDTDIWYDGVSKHEENAKTLTFELNAPNVSVGGVSVGKNDTTAIKELFDKPLVANVEVTANEIGDQLAGYTVTAGAINVETFANNYEDENGQGLGQRAIDAAIALDNARLGRESNCPLGTSYRFHEALYNENDREKVKQTLHNLGLLGYNYLSPHLHYGNPSSSFFGGSVLSGGHKRGQELLPEPTPLPSPVEKKEDDVETTREIWASYTRTTVDGQDYMDEATPIYGYDLQRAGIVGGIKRQYDATLSGGLFFALTAPELESLATVEGLANSFVNSRMEMTDFQFAGHLEKVFDEKWELALYVAGGHQSMDWERRVQLGDFAETYRADSTGNTLTGTAYLAYRYDLSDRWTLRPTIGVDSEHSWLYTFTEDGRSALGHEIEYTGLFLAQRYRYDNAYYNRNTARVGFSTAIDGPQGFAGLNARVFYSAQLGGKDAPELHVSSVDGAVCLNDLRAETHAMGSEAITVGGGGFIHLNKEKTLTADGDVNAIWYKNASTFNVTGGVSYRF